ncbi:hypothetical protein ACM66B_000786 [Microbotryomycetes sp. NB124-2]
MASPPPSHHAATSSGIRDSEQDEECCPVCLCELSLKLAGEKPHVVPVCGHQLHHDCFEAVYGTVQRAKMKPGPLGLCGVCRRDMKIGDGGEAPSKKNKLAVLAGLGDGPGHTSFKQRSVTKGTIVDDPGNSVDPLAEDALVQDVAFNEPATGTMRGSISTMSSGSTTGRRRRGSITRPTCSDADVVRPVLSVLAEHAQVERSQDKNKKHHLTCMVTIEVPSRLPPPPQSPTSDYGSSFEVNGIEKRLQAMSVESRSDTSCAHNPRPTSPAPSSVYSAYVHGSTAPDLQASHGAFAVVVDNLRKRMHDWKGHSIEEFGALRLFDHLVVRKQSNLRQFIVYLFEEAVLFVADDKSKGFAGKIVDNLTGDREKLRLKGRVYVRHIWSLSDTSTETEQSLTVRMSEDAMEEFVLIFNEHSTLELWKTQLEHLIKLRQQSQTASNLASPVSKSGMSTSKSSDTFASSDYSAPSHGHLSSFSGITRTTASSAPRSKVIYEEGDGAAEFGQFSHPMHVTPHSHSQHPMSPPAHAFSHTSAPALTQQRNVSPQLDSRDFPSLDLMLILSVSNSGPSSLKSSIIRSSLDFVLHHVGPKTRLSLVVFSSGEGERGKLLKTPFISVGTRQGFRRLERIITDVGKSERDDDAGVGTGQREGGFVEHQEERVNIVTACNVALDLVLQRKAKSALTGMILMGDGRDGAQKQQMDLVLARAEAASVPIHALGWGKAHDPAALWMLANHTGGSYTFVKDFYDLRDALAGCIGGILSIASTKTQLHISVPEKRWFKIRKVSGSPHAIVSSEGTDVDVDIGELRYGEKKELLIEVDMLFLPSGFESEGIKDVFGSGLRAKDPSALMNATDAFFYSQTGINPSSLDEYSPTHLYDEEYEGGVPDEVPVLQVNASYRDPVAGKTVSRLSPTPKLLTITVLPTPSSTTATEKRVAQSAADIVRRRMELLSSDMLSRSLLLMTRRQDSQAKRLLDETDRIIATIYLSLQSSAPQAPPTTASSLALVQANERARKTLQACSDAVNSASEACSDRLQFDQLLRYSAAHLSLVLRDQKSWTSKTAVEALYWTTDVCMWMTGKSVQWVETR